MRWKVLLALLALLAIAVAVAFEKTNWLIAGGIAVVVLVSGRVIFHDYNRTKGPTGPPVDVDEGETLLVFACETCGEQLVLLRKGTDVPPRHCAEAMVLRRIPSRSRGDISLS
jgi:hypothetical protein